VQEANGHVFVTSQVGAVGIATRGLFDHVDVVARARALGRVVTAEAVWLRPGRHSCGGCEVIVAKGLCTHCRRDPQELRAALLGLYG